MILKKPTAASSQEDINKYLILPGIAMYFAGQWIVNLNYWGCNQYITQRALGADLQTARKGFSLCRFPETPHADYRYASRYCCLCAAPERTPGRFERNG